MSSDFESIKRRKKQTIEEVPIVLDPDWAVALSDAQRRVEAATSTLDIARAMLTASQPDDAMRDTIVSDAAERQAALDAAIEARDALRAQAGDMVLTFKFRGLAMFEIDELIAEHRPTEDQRKEAKKHNYTLPRYNPDTYPPAIVHTAMVAPDWTLEEVQSLWKDPDWNVAELRALFDAADSVSMSRRVVDLGED